MTEDKLLEEEQAEEESFSLLQWISNHLICILIVIGILMLLKSKIKDWRQRFFAAFLNYELQQQVDVKREKMKKDLFASMHSIKSHDPEVRKEGGIKLLEIGVGTGTNFAHYPEGTRLTVVDPNPHFKQYYDEHRKKFPTIHSEEIIQTTGEEMDMIPDNSIDAVVVTLVFCSVDDTKKILKNILRVLTPGGKFYLYEHIKEFKPKEYPIRALMQTILTKTRIWPFVLDECCLDRDMFQDLEAAGFSSINVERFHTEIDHFVFQLISPSLKGYCVK